MAPGAGHNIRMMGCLRRGRAVQIRTQGAQTGLVVTNGVYRLLHSKKITRPHHLSDASDNQ